MKGNKRKQNGITLIALIITIIVMLMLVGVTINVALNGDLFTQAQTAANDTQIQADQEQLLSAVVGAIGTDAKVDFNKLDNNLPKDWTGSNGTYTSPKGNVFTVDKNGNIDYKGKKTTAGGETPETFSWETVGLTVDTNTEYIAEGGIVLRFSTDGKLSILSQGINVTTVDATDSKYINNGIIDFTEEIMGEKTRVKVEMNTNNKDIDLTIIFFEEGGIIEQEPQVITCVKVVVDSENIYTNEEVMQALGETGGEYKGTWTVIERDESGNPTKLVSTTAVTYCELGEDGNLEKCISDYKNAETILNTKAKEATGIESARSIKIEDIYDIIGEENVNKGTDYGKKWNYYYNTEDSKVYSKYQTGTDEIGQITWSTGTSTGKSSKTFVDEEGKTVVVDSEGDNVTLTDTEYYFNLTEEQRIQLRTLSLEDYWLASPCVKCFDSEAHFIIRYTSDSAFMNEFLFTSRGWNRSLAKGVRAVVSVSEL